MLPKIVIVGRPNVGKSSLLNLLAGRLVSIVAPTPGVTRDRISTIVQLPISLHGPRHFGQAPGLPLDAEPARGRRGKKRRGRQAAAESDELESSLEGTPPTDAPLDEDAPAPGVVDASDPSIADDPDPARPWVEVIDTGGYGIEDTQNLTADVERQIGLGLDQADVVLFVIDAQTGIVSLDREVARMLRKKLGDRKKATQSEAGAHPGAPAVVLVANKVDSEKHESGAAEASRLGFGDPLMVSAVSGYNEDLLLEAIRANLPAPGNEASTFGGRRHGAPDSGGLGMLLAIVGKRNAGKSTLVNALAGEERMIVSELEGTTRDSVDVRFEMDGRVFTAIDTAGVRKTKSLKDDVEYYSQHRALRSVRRAHVVLLLLDATVPVSHVDQQLAHEVALHHKPCIVVVNKWDLAQEALAKGKTTQEEFVTYLDKELAGVNYAPLAFISAKNGEGMRELVNEALSLYTQAGLRIPTSQLNRVVEEAMAAKPPSSGIGRRPRLYYLTQLAVHPPTIALFVNDPTMFDAGYQRYLINRFRETLPFAEVPIKLFIRGRERERGPGRSPGRAPGASPAPGAGAGARNPRSRSKTIKRKSAER